MNFTKNQKGFTLVELVVVIAIIGILAGIAVPRFLDATASARGAKIVADMRTIQSAEMIYYAKNAKYPTAQNDFADLVQGNWPGVPTGKFIIAQVLKKVAVLQKVLLVMVRHILILQEQMVHQEQLH
ncbi:MAG: prepilin-type N-terminal cleavage/methylation domain-containing protein [Phascolarctobacterium faecium]